MICMHDSCSCSALPTWLHILSSTPDLFWNHFKADDPAGQLPKTMHLPSRNSFVLHGSLKNKNKQTGKKKKKNPKKKQKNSFLILQNIQCTPCAVAMIFKLKSGRFGRRCLDCSCFYPVHMETVSKGAKFSSISVRHAS